MICCQDTDESDSESVQNRVMETQQSPELEEEAAEEAHVMSTVGYNSPCRKHTLTHSFLLDVIML